MPTLVFALLILPLTSAILVALLGAKSGPGVRWASLVSTLASLIISIILAIAFATLPRIQETRLDSPPPTSPDFKPEMSFPPLEIGGTSFPFQFFLGIDGLNIWLIVLTAVLMVSSVLVSWKAVQERVNEFYAWLLALQAAMVGVFLAFDIILFYVFFELTLVPLFFLIGIWGGPQRQYAARKFFVYTLAGSLITLLGVLGLVFTLAQEHEPHQLTFAIPTLVQRSSEVSRVRAEEVIKYEREVAENRTEVDRKSAALSDAERRLKENPEGVAEKQRVAEARRELEEAEGKLTASIQKLDAAGLWRKVQLWVFAAMMVGFAIKVPLFPVHTWLPLAHVEAPTAGSVLLAGVLLKIGSYGFLRLCVPLVPDASLSFGAPLLGTLSVVGILYGAWCAYAQDDIKKLVAYSSVSHLGYCMLGLFALNEMGLTGSLLQMINHGLSTGALFLIVGMLYERYHTRRMDDYGGMGARLKVLSVFMVFICMSSVGLPGLNGFWGEVAVLLGAYDAPHLSVVVGADESSRRVPILAMLAAAGMVFGALYTLTMLRRVFFGPVKEPRHEGHDHVRDLDAREVAALVPIAALCLALGLYPKPFLDSVRADVRVVARAADEARQREAKRQQPPAEAPARAALP